MSQGKRKSQGKQKSIQKQEKRMTAAAVVDVVDLNVISHNQPFPGIHEFTNTR